MTNLVIKNKIKLFGPRKDSLPGYRDFNMILRHMMLKGSLSEAAAKLNPLFQGDTPELPRWLRGVIELSALPSSKINNAIWRVHAGEDQLWHQAFSEAELVLGPKAVSNEKKFGVIFAHNFFKEAHQLKRLGDLYNHLSPGGTLIVGPINGTAKDTPSSNGSFSQLLHWINKHQCFPSGMCDSASQQQNAITLGNSANPLLAWGVNGKGGYAIFRKPRIRLI